ncbi:fimbria/pilus periplasmic chaperone [Providencia sp.]
MFFRLVFTFILIFINVSVYSKTYLDKTRVIIKESDKEGTVNVYNVDSSPILLQVWVDDGRMNDNILKIKTPFLIADPMLKVSAKDSHQIRVLFVDNEILQKNKESVFWLNILEIKENKGGESNELVNISIRTRIKLFYRPKSLDSIISDDLAKELKFTLINSSGSLKIKVTNPTPIHQTFSMVSTDNGVNLISEDDMVAPYSSITWNVNENIKVGDSIKYFTVNDNGVESAMVSTIE